MENPNAKKTAYIDRPPRIQPPLPEQEVEIPPPPDKKGRDQSFVQILLPLMSILGYSLVSVFGGGRNILFMIPMALSIVVSTSYAAYSFLKERKRVQELTKAYADRLRQMRSDMDISHHDQKLYYEHTHPSNETVQEIGAGRQDSRIGGRLWERRMGDHDFATIRLGIGDIPSRVVYTFKNSGSVDEDEQMGEAYQLAEDSVVVHDAPVIIPMRPYQTGAPDANTMAPGTHSIGVSGNAPHVMDVMRSVLLQLTAFHAPTDFQVYIVGSPEADDRWAWARWLPHTNQGDLQEGDRMCFQPPLAEKEDPKKTKRMYPKRFLASINKQLEDRRLLLEEGDDSGKKQSSDNNPFLLLIVDNLPTDNTNQTTDWIDDLVSEAAIATLLKDGQRLSAGVMFMVSENAKIPSDCRGVYEIKVSRSYYTFRYSEIGQNSPRFIGRADRVNENLAEAFARAISDKEIRQSYGANLKNSIDILELFNTNNIADLDVVKKWDESKRSGKDIADWLRVPIGIRSGDDIHEIYFHQDYDGVHGMIAGTTGSGKSELLLTLIAGLAINYDPAILNFVLVDYKGGSAFKPFEGLPHCVDIVTNLDGKAVDRMFVAIDSELRRRSKMLADYNVKHIVEYRERGYHYEEPFPHLFIVVDEFAEMINENKEYKSRFDSITRLGRAIGVNLILATQRPSGVVTDQMRANMKLRMCLRVETGDDSRELLGRSDAMFLPSSIPGRAYVQVGKDTPNLIQVARAGGEYKEPSAQETIETDIKLGIVTPTDIPTKEKEEDKTIVDMIVKETIQLAKLHSIPQHKPWPNPLPLILPLNHPIDATHLVTNRKKIDNQIILHPTLRAWMTYEEGSEKVKERIDEWRNSQLVEWNYMDTSSNRVTLRPLQAPIGLIDLPSLAQQIPLSLNLTDGPIVLFGAGGWGKTTFLKTLLLSLAATHSPRDLWMYVLDFARGGLEDLEILPHMEKPIDVTEEARVERLLRMLATMLDERSIKIREYGSLTQYNAKNPEEIFPAILVAIDNFVEFKETYEAQLPQLAALIRDGRALGIYFVVTADQVNAIPSKIFSLFTQRLTLKLADDGDYQGVVGRAAHILSDFPGRGVISVDREAREFHVGVITKEPAKKKVLETLDALPEEETEEAIDYVSNYREVAKLMNDVWDDSVSIPKVEALRATIDVRDLDKRIEPQGIFNAAIGLRDVDRQTAWLELMSHCLLLGTPVSGKTTLLQTAILALAEEYSPDELGIILVDSSRKLYNYSLVDKNAKNHFGSLPHVLRYVSEPEELDLLGKYLDAELNVEVQKTIRERAEALGIQDVFLQQAPKQRHLLIIVDNYDDIGDFERPKFIEKLANMLRKYRDRTHLIISGTPEILRNRDQLIKRADSARYSIVLQSVETIRNIGGKVSFNLNNTELPIGRGFIMKTGRTNLFQSARLANQHSDDNYTEELDKQITQISSKYKEQDGKWYFQGSESFLEQCFEPVSAVLEHEPEYEEIEIKDDVADYMQQILNNVKKSDDDKK